MKVFVILWLFNQFRLNTVISVFKIIFVINVFRRQGCPHLGQGHGPIVSSIGFNFEISEDTMSGHVER